MQTLHHQQKWDRRFAELEAFKNCFGHCVVRVTGLKMFHLIGRRTQNKSLGFWVMHQRLAKRRGKVRPEHIQKLNELGFEWRS